MLKKVSTKIFAVCALVVAFAAAAPAMAQAPHFEGPRGHGWHVHSGPAWHYGKPRVVYQRPMPRQIIYSPPVYHAPRHCYMKRQWVKIPGHRGYVVRHVRVCERVRW